MALHFLDIIRSISSAEVKNFDEYLKFAHKNEKKALEAWKILRPLATTKSTLNEEILFEKVFDRKPDILVRHALRPIQNILHDLKNFLLEYFAWQEFRTQGENREALLLRLESLRKRGMVDLYRQQIEKNQKRREKSQKLSAWGFLTDWMLLHHHYFFATDDTWKDRNQELETLICTFNAFYAIVQKKYQIEWESRQNVNRFAAKMLDFKGLDYVIEGLRIEKPALIGLFEALGSLIAAPDEAGFQALLAKYKDDEYSEEERLFLLMMLINYKVRQANQNQPEATEGAFALYRLGIRDKIFEVSGFFPTAPFHNIVTIACRLKRLDWALQFIKEKGPLLNADERENATNLALVKVNVEKGDFEPARAVFNQIDINSMADSLQLRLLRIRTFYELPDYRNLLKPECANLKQYIHKKGTISVQRPAILTFCKVVLHLANKEKKQAEALVNQHPDVIGKEWLLEKIRRMV